MRRFFVLCFFAALSATLAACSPALHPEEPADPLEDVNRGIFWANDRLDVYLLEPVASTYDEILPDPVHKGVTNFFANLRYPMYLVSDVVQLKFGQAAEHTGRFLINTTVGLFGLMDVAKEVGLPDHREDFGLALAYHGVPAGPYLVLPVLGPTNLRDGVGQLVDFFLDPFTILEFSSVRAGISDPIIYSASGLKLINTRAGLLEAIEAAKSSSLDYYLFMQSAYYQYRRGLLWDGNPPDEEDDEFDDEEGNAALFEPKADEEEAAAAAAEVPAAAAEENAASADGAESN